jgi:hypothetical protein
MSLAPTLSSLEALYRKLEREMYRSYHQRDAIHKADHFFNFCVTAHSMRDYFLERLGKIEKSDRQPYEDQWAKESLLVAAADIANSTKHFVLRSPRTLAPRTVATKRVGLRKNEFVDIYMNGRGEIRTVQTLAPDMTITVSDGQKYDLYKFMIDVLGYWHSYLASHNIQIRRQSISRLRGSAT